MSRRLFSWPYRVFGQLRSVRLARLPKKPFLAETGFLSDPTRYPPSHPPTLRCTHASHLRTPAHDQLLPHLRPGSRSLAGGGAGEQAPADVAQLLPAGGKSAVVAMLGLAEAIWHPGTRVIVISASHRQSRELFGT